MVRLIIQEGGSVTVSTETMPTATALAGPLTFDSDSLTVSPAIEGQTYYQSGVLYVDSTSAGHLLDARHPTYYGALYFMIPLVFLLVFRSLFK